MRIFIIMMFWMRNHMPYHYTDVIMSLMVSQVTSLPIVYSPVCSGTDQRKHQSSASLAFVRGIHRGPVNSPHKRTETQKVFPFDGVIMLCARCPQIQIQKYKFHSSLFINWWFFSHKQWSTFSFKVITTLFLDDYDYKRWICTSLCNYVKGYDIFSKLFSKLIFKVTIITLILQALDGVVRLKGP